MRVLVACETSGRVREAFRARGHQTWSVDLLPADDRSPYHYQGDARELLAESWDLLIAHPPCRYLCNSGVRWFSTVPRRKDPGILYGVERFAGLAEGAELFNAFWQSAVPRVCIENPVVHEWARLLVGPHTQVIQPHQFGHGEIKTTCLWLRGLPLLQPTQHVEGRHMKCHRASPHQPRRINLEGEWEEQPRWKARAETYQGIAEAMADQWGRIAVGNNV